MLCKALKLIRSYYDMSQTELSAELGLSNSYLSEIESGKKQPSIDLLQKYSDYFDIPLSSILFSLKILTPLDQQTRCALE